jgi:hypothetical protein
MRGRKGRRGIRGSCAMPRSECAFYSVDLAAHNVKFSAAPRPDKASLGEPFVLPDDVVDSCEWPKREPVHERRPLCERDPELAALFEERRELRREIRQLQPIATSA